ncbi:hypothetical protein INS49_012945 [Diaporthe citri]|uniref:uncharacterized protein n=1 Tax=Diaporthe citri TaxID=83186 RepID=UPI001C7F919A|nr:uncharacterized protein INS49_012945 [Diaporthe citri]KAG6359424.1 hypothetical protein INS49_012945 [Diaporthe citri]
MAVKVTDEDSVLILLSTKSPTSITHPERRILLTQSRPTLKIGRSSNRSALGLTPTLDNGYFDSPVMSREHAEIEADIPRQVVRIRDAGSMHGTYLNDEQLDTEVARPLVVGDEVTFGSSVYRNQKTFKPATVTVGIEFQTAQADHSPSRVFTVPDDCSTDENEPLDDNAPQKIPTYISEQEINPWREEMNEQQDVVRQIDGIIEIESTSESDSDALPHDCISILSGDGDHDAMDAGDLAAEFDDDDDESISLTDDEETSSAPASPVESIDLDDLDLEDNNGVRSPSWNSVSTDPQSEHMAEQPPSGHNSEDEQGVFLYDSESEEMDDIDPIDVDFDPYAQPVIHQSQYPPAQTTLPTQPIPSGHPILPSISTAVSQQGYPDFNCQLAPVMQPAPRQPSPSDAVLPVGRRHHGSEDDCVVTVKSLGLKSGKPDFFEAREQNKIKMAHSGAFHGPGSNPFAQIASDTANIDKDVPRPVTEDILQCPTSSSTEVEHPSASALNKEAQPEPNPQLEAHTAPVPQPFTGFSARMKSQGNQALAKSSYDFIPMTLEDALSAAPLEETSETDIKMQEAVDPTWTAASADELFQMKQLAQIRTNEASGCRLDPPEAPMAAERPEPRKDTTKGKRKAADISDTTDEERMWQELEDAGVVLEPSSPALTQPEIEMDLSRLSFHNTSEQGSTAVRPTKMRKIAERVGYAALGGATVGAMVLTSLIYTAPNFA